MQLNFSTLLYTLHSPLNNKKICFRSLTTPLCILKIFHNAYTELQLLGQGNNDKSKLKVSGRTAGGMGANTPHLGNLSEIWRFLGNIVSKNSDSSIPIKSVSSVKVAETPKHNSICSIPKLWIYQKVRPCSYVFVDTPFCRKSLSLALPLQTSSYATTGSENRS